MHHNYDNKSKESIYEYAKLLEGKTFRDVCDEDKYYLVELAREITEDEYKLSYENKNRKGGLGELIEERYFHYKADNEARPDFPEANVELKVSPYKINKNKSISAKERLIISMINYMDIPNMDFSNSNAWEKMENILLIYYLWQEEIEDRLDYVIDYVYMFSPEGEDLEIIKNDFYTIKNKILNGKAHELSEGDTLYLGAATKSATSKNLTKQPFSEIMAKPRAFSLKSSYMTYVLRNYITNGKYREDKILKDDKIANFENYIISKIDKYKDKKDVELFELFFNESKITSKNKYSRLAYEILGVRTKNAEEFEKANIKVKSIRIEENNKIKESISFPSFKILDLINQSWETSDVYKEFSETKYLFVIYKKYGGNYYLKGSMFWNMPLNDLETVVKSEWRRVIDIFKTGIILEPSRNKINNNLPKLSDTKILHVRPHATLSYYCINGVEYGSGKKTRDSDKLPNGDRMTKQCFWLNKTYVLEQIKKTTGSFL